jgi:hypothetical protein
LGRVLLLLTSAHLADLALTTLAVARHGPSVEVNPLVGGVLALGIGGIVAWKAALLAVILAAAALNPRWQRPLLAGGLLSGLVGAGSGLVALV